MSDDDDQTCAGHVWVLGQVHLTLDHAGMGYECARCGAVRYDDAQDARRERL